MQTTSTEQNPRTAILIGSAPEGKIQPKLKEMADFLQTEKGGNWAPEDILILPNGTNEHFLKKYLNYYGCDKMFYYLCTNYATQEWEQKIWFSANEISKSLFEKNEKEGIYDVQLIYDVDRNYIDYDISGNFINNSDQFQFISLK